MSNLTVYLAMLMLGSNFSSTALPKPATAQVVTIDVADEEQRFIDLVNYERWSHGLRMLKIDPLLVDVSRKHSKEMADLSYFNHISPTRGQRTALDRYLYALGHRPQWAYLGENLFYCSITDVNRGHTCLMDSEGHRANILNPRFERIGVGMYRNDDGEFWVTQMFIASVD